jgi:LPXTG-motif cell wall-anchored protein
MVTCMGRGNHSFSNIRNSVIGVSIGVAVMMAGSSVAAGNGYPPTTVGAPTTAAAPVTVVPTVATTRVLGTGGGSGLPRTGSEFAPFLFGGIGVLGIGLGTLVISRRRTSPSL